MSNRYWIKRGDFANQYWLEYTTTPEQDMRAESEGCERIKLKEAIRLCRAERDRRKYDPAFSGYADDRIWPYGVDRDSVYASRGYYDSGFVIYWPNV